MQFITKDAESYAMVKFDRIRQFSSGRLPVREIHIVFLSAEIMKSLYDVLYCHLQTRVWLREISSYHNLIWYTD